MSRGVLLFYSCIFCVFSDHGERRIISLAFLVFFLFFFSLLFSCSLLVVIIDVEIWAQRWSWILRPTGGQDEYRTPHLLWEWGAVFFSVTADPCYHGCISYIPPGFFFILAITSWGKVIGQGRGKVMKYTYYG